MWPFSYFITPNFSFYVTSYELQRSGKAAADLSLGTAHLVTDG